MSFWRLVIAAVTFGVSSGCGGVITTNDASAGDASVDQNVDQNVADVANLDAPATDAGILGWLAFENDTTDHYASFLGLFGPNTTDGCTPTVFGACAVYDCLSGPNDAGPSPTAGTLTLFAPSANGVGISPDSAGQYNYVFSTLSAGDLLGVSASGGDVPAFGEHTVTMPAMITLTSPQQPFSISKTQDLTLTWSGGESGAHTLATVFVQGSAFIEVNCTFDAASGSGTIPNAALSPLVGQNNSGNIVWGQDRSTYFSSGAFPLQLDGMQFASAPVTFY